MERVIVATLTFRLCLHALCKLLRKVSPGGDYILGVLLFIGCPVLACLFWSCRNLRLVGPGMAGILRNRPWVSSLQDDTSSVRSVSVRRRPIARQI